MNYYFLIALFFLAACDSDTQPDSTMDTEEVRTDQRVETESMVDMGAETPSPMMDQEMSAELDAGRPRRLAHTAPQVGAGRPRRSAHTAP